MAATLLPSCGGDEIFVDITRDPRFPGEPAALEAFSHLLEYEPAPACEPRSATPLNLSFELRVFRSPEVSMEDVKRFLGALQRYYDWFGVAFFVRHEVLEVPFSNVMNLRTDEVDAHLKRLGLEPTPENRLQATFHNLTQFMNAYAVPARPEYNLVVVEHTSRGNFEFSDGQQRAVVGLGLGPRLFAKGNQVSDIEALLKKVGLPESFTPTAFVAASNLRVSRWPDLLVAHEFGHAVGMPHVTTGGNLMFPTLTRDECVAELNGPQMEDLRIARSGGGLQPEAIEIAHSPDFLEEVFRSFQLP